MIHLARLPRSPRLARFASLARRLPGWISRARSGLPAAGAVPVLFGALVLTACGGGGDDSTPASTSNTATATSPALSTTDVPVKRLPLHEAEGEGPRHAGIQADEFGAVDAQ